MADVGASTTASVVETLETEARDGSIEGGEALRERLIGLLAETATVGDGRIDIRAEPTVILMVGVNGTGKTTTTGKLAWHLHNELHRSVLLAAADTFRAAASEQLEGWAQRAGAEFVTGPEGSDPGAVAFEAIAQARSRGVDVVIIDTAGRLHTQGDLMGELGKVRRVIARQLEGAPHETLLTLDATTGQNGLRQARLFAESAQVTGVVLAKLDGTARGGIALAIARELELPVKLIGVGESVEDLRPFDAEDFARAMIAEG
jgi:fused signal recognition particle receptor